LNEVEQQVDLTSYLKLTDRSSQAA